MNKSILITGANSGLGKETARQLALLPETEKVILACRNLEKAKKAKDELEVATGKDKFEIVIMDVSNKESVQKAVATMGNAVDAVVLNAGGIGGRTAGNLTPSGMNELAATNLLGHVVLVDELIANNKLNNEVVYVSSEAARGVKKMGMKRPLLKTNSSDELASVLDGSYFGDKFDPMQAYGHVKYVGTLWNSAMARKFPSIKFIAISPGSTSGTAGADNAAPMVKFMFKYIMMPIVLPLRGMVHKVDAGAARFVDVLTNTNKFETGSFYASEETKLVGELVDQFNIHPVMANEAYQDNAYDAIHRFTN